MDGDAAADRILSKGACRGIRGVPSPVTKSTFRLPSSQSRRDARTPGKGYAPWLTTRRGEPGKDRVWIAGAGADLENFFGAGEAQRRSSPRQMKGWDIVCPSPMGAARRRTALVAHRRSRKWCLGISSIADSTRSSRTPLRRIWLSTILPRRASSHQVHFRSALNAA